VKDEELTKAIIGCAFNVHNTLGAGFLEQVYENALRIELAKQGLQVKQQAPIEVYYDGQVVGCYYADLWVEDRVIVELKAVRQLSKAHEVQLVNYLTATGADTGLLLNFGPSVQIKRKFREYKPKTSGLRPGESSMEEILSGARALASESFRVSVKASPRATSRPLKPFSGSLHAPRKP
jgi:GxxExxY protein